jgi:hypothetical protein
MGLLDEAIREHLELKRRAGADAGEVARQEREALGPVVRGDPLTSDLPPNQPIYEGHPPDQFEPEHYDEPEDEFEDEFDEPQEPETSEHQAEPPQAAAPAHYPPAAPPAHPPAAHPPGEEPHAGQDDELLEQTPEFLQETPEHDRLWFEQAPPQEFDFDK